MVLIHLSYTNDESIPKIIGGLEALAGGCSPRSGGLEALAGGVRRVAVD